MNKINYNEKMENIIKGNNQSGIKKKLLLHSCCAPCSSSVLERIKDYFDVTVYYYNPNLDSEKEFLLRENEQKRLCELLSVEFIGGNFNSQEFYSVVKGLEKEKEGGKRCAQCFKLRLEKTAKKAKEMGFDYFATTLTVSPLKNATVINQIGKQIEEKEKVNYLPSDFKKKNGYLRSIALSNEFGLYRQNYCGCVFSMREVGLQSKDNEKLS